MRPAILSPLFADVTSLPGIGDRGAHILEERVGRRVLDLVFHLPMSGVDRREMPPLLTARGDSTITAIVTVGKHTAPFRKGRQPYKIHCQNETGDITLVFFNVKGDYLSRQLPEGQERVISGRVERFDGMLQMAHPDVIALPSELEKVARFEPVYLTPGGIARKTLRKAIEIALSRVPDLPEWQDIAYREKQQWPGWKSALTQVHHPSSDADLLPMSSARMRLAYDELLAHQLAMLLLRGGRMQKEEGYALESSGTLAQKLEGGLPFQLTGGQKMVIGEVLEDMRAPCRMLRLLQGDVGSGKTVVALMAMLHMLETGRQAALMAPTEILARQHAASIDTMIQSAGLVLEVSVVLLTGQDKGAARKEKEAQIADGRAKIVIGTHALFQESVQFHDLGFVVIDEQHRFGVKQRLKLAEKGARTDLLLMTATPIPRTLALTLYGDMDVSSLKEKPAGRQVVDTRIVSSAREEEVIAAIGRAMAKGEQIYWVCPLIEESTDPDTEENGLAAATERFASLKAHFGGKVGLVHGRMKGDEKAAVMQAFISGEILALVATTVIEVGVDAPNATLMVIEHAQQFGLSQLHQLRGRVGRHDLPSHCILLYDAVRLSETGRRRLEVLRETEDGFRIAEEDMGLRGTGELMGTRQSGLPDFTFAHLPEQMELMLAARDDARLLLEKDPKLESARGQVARTLLYLFEYDVHTQYLMSG